MSELRSPGVGLGRGLVLWSGLLVVSVPALSCADTETVAPDSSTIEVAAVPGELEAGPEDATDPPDSALVTALVREADGDLVVDETCVAFTTTLGFLRIPNDEQCRGPSPSGGLEATVGAETRNGLVTVVLRAGADTGSAVVTARSGKAMGSVTVRIVAIEEAADSTESPTENVP